MAPTIEMCKDLAMAYHHAGNGDTVRKVNRTLGVERVSHLETDDQRKFFFVLLQAEMI